MNDTKPDDTAALLSAALDEIYSLRLLCAYEAEVISAHLDYKTFPKSRRRIAEKQINRLIRAAEGEAERIANSELPFTRYLRDKVSLLTTSQWREEVHARRGPSNKNHNS